MEENIPYQRDNPTDKDRYEQLMYLLTLGKRPEDFKNIIDVLKPPKDITTICSKTDGRNKKVGIIGAGLAGLSAAFELKKIGCDITIFEATNRIGGRVYTHYFDEDKKYYTNLGPMRIPVSHETTWHYINLFNLNTMPFINKNVNGLFYVGDSRAINDPEGISVMKNIYPKYNLTEEEKRTPWQDLVGRIFDKYLLGISQNDRKELIEVKPKYAKAINEIDNMTYREAYESVGLSQDAISMLGYLSTFDGPLFNISLTEILQEAYTADFAFTYQIDGGNINLVSSIYEAITNNNLMVYKNIDKDLLGNVTFKMQIAVDGIYENCDSIVLKCRNTESENISYEEFDYVICAIPFTSLRRVDVKPQFSVIKNQAIRELNYEPLQKTAFLLKDRFWEMDSENNIIPGGSSSTDLPIISTFYSSDHAIPVKNKLNTYKLRPGTSPMEPGVLMASYNLSQEGERLGNENIDLRMMDIKRYVETVHGLPPGFIDERMLAWASIYWPEVQYIWSGGCLSKVSDKKLFSYNITLPEMNNKVFFAGEHISQKHLWMQGALKTAMVAANEIALRINGL